MRLAAGIAAGAAVVDLLVLGLLHVVSPEVDPVARAVSEYALGDFGWLATVRTGAQALGPIALAAALRRERVGALLLLVFGLLKLAMLFFPVDAIADSLERDLSDPARLATEDEVAAISDGAPLLTDDFAPTDALISR